MDNLIDIFDELLDTGGNIKDIVEDQSTKFKKMCATTKKLFETVGQTIKMPYNYLYYTFNQETLDKLIYPDYKRLQGANIGCEFEPDAYIILDCDESDVLLSFLNSTQNLDKLKETKNIKMIDIIIIQKALKKLIHKLKENKHKLFLMVKVLKYFIEKQASLFDNSYLIILNILFYGPLFINIFGIKGSFDEYDGSENSFFMNMIIPFVSKMIAILALNEKRKEVLSTSEEIEEKKLYVKNYKENLVKNNYLQSIAKLNILLQKIFNKIKIHENWTDNIKDKHLDLTKICINNLKNCNQTQCEFSEDMKKIIDKINADRGLIKMKTIEIDTIIQSEIKSLEVLYLDISNKIYNFVKKYLNFDNIEKSFTLNIENLKKIIDTDVYEHYESIKADIQNNNRKGFVDKNINITIIEKLDDFMKILNQNDLVEINYSLNELIYVLFLIIFYLEKKDIIDMNKNDLELKIKNIIYINIIKSGIITFDKQIDIKTEIVKKISNKELPTDLIDYNDKTDGILFENYFIEMYNLFILNLILNALEPQFLIKLKSFKFI